MRDEEITRLIDEFINLKIENRKLLEFVIKVSYEDCGFSPIAKEANELLKESGEI